MLPQALPGFLQPHSQQFLMAGWQLRILDKLQPSSKLFVEQIRAIASNEASEANLLMPKQGEACKVSLEIRRHLMMWHLEVPLLHVRVNVAKQFFCYQTRLCCMSWLRHGLSHVLTFSCHR